MDYKKEILKELEALRDLGIERPEIEKGIEVGDNYIDQVLARGGNKVALSKIKMFHQLLLHNATLAQSYTDKRRDQKNNGTKKEVPVYGGFSTLGNIVVYDDEGLKNEVIGTLPPNIFPNCDYAEKAKGDSMYPLIMNQALLVGKICSAKGISFGEKYIIKTKDGLDTTKFVHPALDDNKKRIDGKILLVAHNKSIPPQEIDIADITFSCRVHWIVNPT